MRAKEEIHRCRSRGNGISVTYLLLSFWFLATAKGLISWLMALWLCASSGSLPGLTGSLFPFSRRGRGLERGLYRGRPPHVSQRMNAEVTQNVVMAGQRVGSSVRNNGRNPMRAGREGGRDRCRCTAPRAIDVVAPTLRAIIQPQQIHLLKGTTIGLNDSIRLSKRLWYI
jgi:hypothetical protein